MARDKHISIDATPEQLIELSRALRIYAEAAWPPGGSDCAQASRESLLGVADAIEQAQQSTPGRAEFSRRQKATFRAALEYAIEHPELEAQSEIYQTLHRQLTPSTNR
jgi:hypothetical protein